MNLHRFTATEIADLINRADGLTLADNATTHRRVRNFAVKGLLSDGQAVDARGTLAFPAIELYRARVLCALSDLAMDVRALREVVDAAGRDFDLRSEPALSLRSEAGIQSRGGLRDSIYGVACGEPWSLTLEAFKPGHSTAKALAARFQWNDARDNGRVVANRIFGTGRSYAVAVIDLNALYTWLLAEVGEPA